MRSCIAALLTVSLVAVWGLILPRDADAASHVTSRYSAFMEEGRLAYGGGDFQAAARAFAAAAKETRTGQALYWYLRSEYRQGKYEQVTRKTEALLRQDLDLGEYRSKLEKLGELASERAAARNAERAAVQDRTRPDTRARPDVADESTYEGCVQKAKAAFAAGDYETSARLFAEASARRKTGMALYGYLRSLYHLERYEEAVRKARFLLDGGADLGGYRDKIARLHELSTERIETRPRKGREPRPRAPRAQRDRSFFERVGILTYAGLGTVALGGIGIGVGYTRDVDADAMYEEMLGTTYQDKDAFLDDVEELTSLERHGATWKNVGLSCVLLGTGLVAVDLFGNARSLLSIRATPDRTAVTVARRW